MYEDLESPAAAAVDDQDESHPDLTAGYGATMYPETVDGLACAGSGLALDGDNHPQYDHRERTRFAIKVLTTFTLQLACTAVLILLAKLFVPEDTAGSLVGVVIGLSAMFGAITMSIVVGCCTKLMRKTPWNWVVLVMFTLLESVALSWICIYYSATVVLHAASVTCGIFGAMAIMAAVAPFDITGWGPYLMVLLLVLISFAIIVAIGLLWSDAEQFQWAHTAIATGMVLLFSVYIVFDLQLILGGKSHEYGLDDYCFAAIMLYSDVMVLFMHLLDLS